MAIVVNEFGEAGLDVPMVFHGVQQICDPPVPPARLADAGKTISDRGHRARHWRSQTPALAQHVSRQTEKTPARSTRRNRPTLSPVAAGREDRGAEMKKGMQDA
jgi:hypothetical protein